MSSKKSNSKGSRRGSTRPARGKLRRFHSIENVVVEEPFTLFKPAGGNSGGDAEEDRQAGDGCYVTTTVHNRRYYGLLIDQEALKNASLLWFQEEAGSLDLNRRMQMLRDQDAEGDGSPAANGDQEKKRPASTSFGTEDKAQESKRPKLEPGAGAGTAAAVLPDAVPSAGAAASSGPGETGQEPLPVGNQRQVQKFRYVEPTDKKNSKDLGYRILLATFADIEAASEDDQEKARLISTACQAGGGFVGKYYYQYEVLRNALQTAISITDKPDDTFTTSMGFDSFLNSTHLPKWTPLSNLHINQHKVLSLLNMKKDNSGNVVWDSQAGASTTASLKGTHVPMEPRTRYRVGVMGGGISGLACCLELLRLCDSQNIDIEVVMLEGRSRLGGRLLTDRESFKRSDGITPFPVDLGAGWIHGIDHNPLASLAREAGASFVTTSEEVKMLHSGLREVDKGVDDATGKLFDDLLDLGADDCWGAGESSANGARNQMAVRWYSANLTDSKVPITNGKKSSSPAKSKDLNKGLGLKKTDAPPHRQSSDMSIDHAIGKAIAKHKLREFSKLSKDEHLMLQWNMKNVEYALGANISDLSMKFWDSDERHAFEGDHVLLREGYSTVIDYMVSKLEKYGTDKFKPMLNFPIGKIEYARRSTTQKYQDQAERKLVELSDTCCVTAGDDGSRSVKCDFVVCTLPLGVLKHAVRSPSSALEDNEDEQDASVVFEPPLPMSKQDTINTVGFGLLDKLYLQFPTAFWRKPLGLEGDKYLFGNSSGVNPYMYMFTDLGMTLGDEDDLPPILMTLISGKEAVHCEMLSEEEMVQEALETLRAILKPIEVPAPVAVRRTKWGMDKFSRGCYTFLPPGATDQDFNMLQSPLNGNGDSLLLEGSETMRMFFAGEHTTALHPSMAHGAMLSGIRAAKEIVSTLTFDFRNDKATDRLIPVALFRRDNPDIPLQCSLCHEMGSRVREGSLLALKRGARQVLVHNNCAEYSPEVEVYEGQWRHVIKAVNRGKALTCALCNRSGATIGCTHQNCFRVYHFSCSEDTGWRFDREGKVYYCDLHRKIPKGNDADRVSLRFYKSKTANAVLRCFLCGGTDDDKAGKLLAFQRKNRRVLVHEKCARFTTLVDTKEDTESRMGIEFLNVFEAIEKAGTCAKCGRHGATVSCDACDLCYHYPCALETAWKGGKKGSKFFCEYHQKNRPKKAESTRGGMFQHALFSGSSVEDPGRASAPSNEFEGGAAIGKADSHEEIVISDASSDSDDNDCEIIENVNVKLMPTSELPEDLSESKKVQLTRKSVADCWNIGLVAKKIAGPEKDYVLAVGNNITHAISGLERGQIILSINAAELGNSALGSFKDVLSYLGKQVEITVVVKEGRAEPGAVKSESQPEEADSPQAVKSSHAQPDSVASNAVPGSDSNHGASPELESQGASGEPIDTGGSAPLDNGVPENSKPSEMEVDATDANGKEDAVMEEAESLVADIGASEASKQDDKEEESVERDLLETEKEDGQTANGEHAGAPENTEAEKEDETAEKATAVGENNGQQASGEQAVASENTDSVSAKASQTEDELIAHQFLALRNGGGGLSRDTEESAAPKNDTMEH